jgi:hypothetical protein
VKRLYLALALVLAAGDATAATVADITIEQGATWTKAWKTNRVLTGCTLDMEVRDAPGGVLLAAPAYTVTSATRGEFTTSLTALQTQTFTASYNAVYDIEAACSGGVVYRLFEGHAAITSEVTTGELPPGSWPEPAPAPADVFLRVTDAASTYVAQDRLVYDVTTYGAAGDGVTDDSAAVQAAIDAAMGASGTGQGGTIFFPPGTYRIDSQITFPHDGATPPSQPNLRLVGAGAEFSGQTRTPTGGTILDLRFSGSPAKLDTRGLGSLEITGLTLASLGGSDSTAFIQSTNTTLLIHDAGFYGNTALTGTQDAIVLGGATQQLSDATASSAFQGYGTTVTSSYFNRIRRAYWCRTWCNSTVFSSNTIWAASGFASGAAIDIDSVLPDAGAQATGNVVSQNLIEMVGYAYGIRVGYGLATSLIANNFWDPTATTLAYYRMDTGASNTSILDGWHATSKSLLSDVAPTTSATQVITNLTNQSLQIGWNSAQVVIPTLDLLQTGNGAKVSHFAHSNGAEFYSQFGGTASNPDWVQWLKPNGGTADGFLSAHYYGTGSVGVRAQIFENPSGDLRVKASAGSTLWLGDANGQHGYWQESTRNLVINDASGRVSFGGVSSGNVMLTPSGTTLKVRLANDGGDGNLTAAAITATGPVQVQAVVAAVPAISTVCSSSTQGSIVYVDDSNDTAVSHLCFCGTAADDSTYGWRRAESPATACP